MSGDAPDINAAFPDIYPLEIDGEPHPIIHVRDKPWPEVFKHTQAVIKAMLAGEAMEDTLVAAVREAYRDLLCTAEGEAFAPESFDTLQHHAAQKLSDAVCLGVLRVGKFADRLAKSLQASTEIPTDN